MCVWIINLFSTSEIPVKSRKFFWNFGVVRVTDYTIQANHPKQQTLIPLICQYRCKTGNMIAHPALSLSFCLHRLHQSALY